MENRRMKDYFDLWILLRDPHIDRSMITHAIRATFERRQTAIPSNTPIGLSADFASDVLKQSQWNAFARRNALEVPELAAVVTVLRAQLRTTE